MVNMPKGNAPLAPGNARYERVELQKLKPQYDVIRDCVDGEVAIKKKGKKYLPMPNPDDLSAENNARYTTYLERAVFYNVTRRTLAGLMGEIFAVDPVIELPPELEPLRTDTSGSGINLIQTGKELTQFVLAYSRGGLFIDYPNVNGETTREELDTGEIHPTIKVYDPAKIINWRTITRGGRVLLNLVVLEESYDAQDDGFEAKSETQWRVLRLDNEGLYTVEIWRTNNGLVAVPSDQRFTPKDSKGERLKEIPFKFIGAANNEVTPEAPLMYDLASLNRGHYRNSADYEESCFFVGQPTYWFSGLTKDWVKSVLNNNVYTGSRKAVVLPVNGAAGILQPEPNQLAFEAMKHKERQMVALGAKLVEDRSVQRTATEAGMDERAENSVLASAANNVSDGMTWACKIAARFVGAPEDDIEYTCNTEFAINKLSAEEQTQLIAEWQAGLVSFEEARYQLKKSSIVYQADEEARASIEKDAEAKLARDIKLTEAKRPPVKEKPPANQE